jgi:hypothetical protein
MIDQRYRRALGLVMCGSSLAHAAKIEGFTLDQFLADAEQHADLREHWLKCVEVWEWVEFTRKSPMALVQALK